MDSPDIIMSDLFRRIANNINKKLTLNEETKSKFFIIFY
jgi:hypothetical protein